MATNAASRRKSSHRAAGRSCEIRRSPILPAICLNSPEPSPQMNVVGAGKLLA